MKNALRDSHEQKMPYIIATTVTPSFDCRKGMGLRRPPPGVAKRRWRDLAFRLSGKGNHEYRQNSCSYIAINRVYDDQILMAGE